MGHISTMAWEVEYTDEFEAWWNGLNEGEQVDVGSFVELLERRGPTLGYPHCSKINLSKHNNMRELRPQHKGDPYRVFYAFNPKRTAILLIGGNKCGDDRFYETYVPVADRVYDKYLKELSGEE